MKKLPDTKGKKSYHRPKSNVKHGARGSRIELAGVERHAIDG
jgi:hypothetical protein